MAPGLLRAKVSKKVLALRASLWPKLTDEKLWIRTKRDGFITMPRTMPLIMHIMDSMSKGKPVSSAYLELWCRSFDECLVVLSKSDEMAFHAGFTGQRATTTWRNRIQILAGLGFIEIKPGPSGPMSYALIVNPYHIIKAHKAKHHPGIGEAEYNALLARAAEIGADDLG